MPNTLQTKVLPWASAAGALVLVAGTIAGQSGATAAAPQAAPAAPTVNALGVPAEAPAAPAVSAESTEAVKSAAMQSANEALAKAGATERVATPAAPAAEAPAAPAAEQADKGAQAEAKSAKADAPAAKEKAEEFSFVDSSYIHTLRSGGLESYAYIPRDLPQDYGHSYVDLIHDIAQPDGRCEALGAGYWLSGEVEEGVIGKGAAPPDAGDVRGGFVNPTTAREVFPNLSAGENLSNKNPGVKNYFPPGEELVDIPSDGNGVKWTADCTNDVKGNATGNNFDVAGFLGVGSTSAAEVNKETGLYTGTSRAYVLGMTGATGFDSASSLMQVTNKPGEEPVLTYRMTYFTNSPDQVEGSNGISFGGSEIPVSQFAEQFNAAAEQFTAASKPLGSFGAQTLKPEVGVTTDGGRPSVTIAAGSGYIGLAARQGTIGERQGLRFGSVTYSGIYQSFASTR